MYDNKKEIGGKGTGEGQGRGEQPRHRKSPRERQRKIYFYLHAYAKQSFKNIGQKLAQGAVEKVNIENKRFETL